MKSVFNFINESTNILNKNIPVGKHNHIPDEKFNQEQLRKGIQIEFEHTEDPEIAKAIAKDHLSEFEKYYIDLEKMEELLKHP